MKKILTIAAVAGISAAAFGQGLINWSGANGQLLADTNGAAYSPFETSSGNPSGIPTGPISASVTPAFYYELLSAAVGTAAPTSLSAFNTANTVVAGDWNDADLSAVNSTSTAGRILQTGSSASAAANTSNPATVANYAWEVVGWSANLGTTWSAALANLNSWATAQGTVVGTAYFGVSSYGSSAPVTATTSGAGTPVIGAGAGLIYNPTSNPMLLDPLATVPEPGTLALAAIGGASLLMFRRKK